MIAVAPVAAEHIQEAIAAGGGVTASPTDAEALVWTAPDDPAGLAKTLAVRSNLGWVQLPWAGIEPYLDAIRSHPELIWTCAKGVYAEPVAEHALGLALACRRGLGFYAQQRTWTGQRGENLLGANVTLIGGGGIAESFLRLIGPFGCQVTVVRGTPRPMNGAARVVGPESLDQALTGADLVVLALPLLPETKGLMNHRRMGLLAPGGVLVNVARGEHIVTDDLVAALDDASLGSAGLDVTDPEPLPDGHPLWRRSDVIITPHTGNTLEMAKPLLARRVTDNVRRYISGEPLLGYVDLTKGY